MIDEQFDCFSIISELGSITLDKLNEVFLQVHVNLVE